MQRWYYYGLVTLACISIGECEILGREVLDQYGCSYASAVGNDFNFYG